MQKILGENNELCLFILENVEKKNQIKSLIYLIY